MKETISKQVQIANRNYALKINPDEALGFDQATDFISLRLSDLQKNQGIKDTQDLLAMLVLQLASEQLKRKTVSEDEEQENAKRIKALQLRLGTYMSSL